MPTKCYVFDVDIFVDATHRLHFARTASWAAFYAAVDRDLPIRHVIQFAADLSVGAAIVFSSSRADSCRRATVQWMGAHGVPKGPMHMRCSSDHRNSEQVKADHIAQIRADGFEIVAAFVDSERVKKALEKAGVPCIVVTGKSG